MPLPSSTAAQAAPEAVRAPLPRRTLWRHRVLPVTRYLLTTDVHTYAFSVAANAILSFFPFILLLMTLIRNVFRSETMYTVVVQLLQDYLPTGQEFIVRNLNVLVNARRGTQLVSLLILLVTANGVFLPLEVALNRVWGFKNNRSYIGNQLISLGLAFGCGLLALTSIALTAGHQVLLQMFFGGDSGTLLFRALAFVSMKGFAFLASIGIFFLIYWALPNGHVPARKVLPVAISMGLLLEVAKYAYVLALPWLNFREVYGPFAISVTLIFWAFLAGMLLLAGAFLSAESAQTAAAEPATPASRINP